MNRKTSILLVSLLIAVLAFFVIKELVFTNDKSIGKTLSQYGFIELRPPSTLVPPGTWVSVLKTDPLQLGIVCTPDNALGKLDTESLKNSSSAETEMIDKLSGSYNVGTEIMKKVQSSLKFNEVENISFQLKNLRVVELPDDVVMDKLKDRAPFCWEAIRFRVNGKEPVSMVKSVLIADVDYKIEFSRQLESNTEAKLKKELALELDLKLKSSQDGTSTLVGRGLIWGIREDARLATVGLGLPSTGGTADTIHVLSGKGSVSEILSLKPARSTLENKIISYDVEPLRQNSPMSCWGTVYTMMRSWKEQKSLSVNSVVASLGSPWDDYYVQDTGLPGGKEKDFVAAVNMDLQPPASYPLETFIEMLKKFGPLWIITGDGISSHARLLVGIYGNVDAEGIEAYQTSTFEFIDPFTGSYQYENALTFVQNFEAEARFLVDRNLDNVELRYQILHWPSNTQ